MATLKKVGNTAENPSMEAQLLVREAFSKERPAGLRIVRAVVDLGECGPQPKRIEIRRLPLPALSTAGNLGETRVVILPFWFSTADDARVEIAGAVATYDVANRASFDECFSDETHAARRVVQIATPSLRVIGHGFNLQSIEGVTGRLAGFIRERGLGLSEQCGVELGSVDYSAATITHLSEIVCEENPDEPECS